MIAEISCAFSGFELMLNWATRFDFTAGSGSLLAITILNTSLCRCVNGSGINKPISLFSVMYTEPIVLLHCLTKYQCLYGLDLKNNSCSAYSGILL